MKFLGESPLKKLIALIKGDLANKADKNHTHNYAGSSSAGGAANSANKLNTDAGSATNPVYFANGVPVNTTYTLGKSVPSDAKFTDTVTEVDATLTAGGTNPVQGGAIKSYIDDKTAGLTGAMHFQGKATVDITDGSITDPVISGYDFANKKAKGDVILGQYDHKEFVWDGDKWELLGDEGSYVLNTVKINNKSLSGDITLTAADVGAATANDITNEIGKLDANEVGGTGKYIQSIQQTNGKISATAGTMPTALKNPNALTFTGAVTGTYDGSAAKTVNIPAAITVDSALSDTSTNPVQNKAVANAIVGKKSDTGTSAEIFNDYTSNVAIGNYSHAEGIGTTASGDYSHAEGNGTEASGNNSHAEGGGNIASGDYSHAEGIGTTASGYYSHAEGYMTIASGYYSHAEGNGTEASGNSSHAQNFHTLASYAYQTAMGKYNSNKVDTLLEVGNGADDGARSNAFEVYDDGHAEVKTMGSTDNSLTTKKYVDARIPAATTTDNGKFLRVVNGVPTWVALTNVAEEGA